MNTKKIMFICCLIFSSIISTYYLESAYASAGVAKAIILRGEVNIVDPTGTKSKLTKQIEIPEGAVIETAAKSFCKIRFTDGTMMSLGPKSKMNITKVASKNKAGIISLLKGKLRSKVSKDYLKESGDKKNKLFIKTKNASMGVRGTELISTFDPATLETGLITLSGIVAMIQIDESLSDTNDPSKLEKAMEGPTVVLVMKGQFSGTSQKLSRPTTPVKVDTSKLEALKKDSEFKLKGADKILNKIKEKAIKLEKKIQKAEKKVKKATEKAKKQAKKAKKLAQDAKKAMKNAKTKEEKQKAKEMAKKAAIATVKAKKAIKEVEKSAVTAKKIGAKVEILKNITKAAKVIVVPASAIVPPGLSKNDISNKGDIAGQVQNTLPQGDKIVDQAQKESQQQQDQAPILGPVGPAGPSITDDQSTTKTDDQNLQPEVAVTLDEEIEELIEDINTQIEEDLNMEKELIQESNTRIKVNIIVE